MTTLGMTDAGVDEQLASWISEKYGKPDEKFYLEDIESAYMLILGCIDRKQKLIKFTTGIDTSRTILGYSRE
jgi:hypothetical protein